MAEKAKKMRKRREDVDGGKASKDEYAIAKFMKSKLPVKRTTLMNHRVEYFTGVRAVNLLMESQWAQSKKGKTALFTSRESVVAFLNVMLTHKFFHRAQKIYVEVSKKDGSKSKRKAAGGGVGAGEEDTTQHEKEDNAEKEEQSKDGDHEDTSKSDQEKKKSDTSGKGSKKNTGASTPTDEKKEKRKVKLDMHLEQIFQDNNDAYVWIYDPIPTRAWLIGGLLVIGAIVVCLFPLWPPIVRKGVYYCSIGAAAFLCAILVLAVLRLAVFCLVWAVTFGHHHLWMLPNLTEDVGFFESFWPLYKYEYRGAGSTKQKDKNKKKDKTEKKSKSSDKETSVGAESGKADKESTPDKIKQRRKTDQLTKNPTDNKSSGSESETGSESVNEESMKISTTESLKTDDKLSRRKDRRKNKAHSTSKKTKDNLYNENSLSSDSSDVAEDSASDRDESENSQEEFEILNPELEGIVNSDNTTQKESGVRLRTSAQATS